MLEEKSLKDILQTIESYTPSPGGGSVAAIVGALGGALVQMQGIFTINKKSYEQLHENARKDFEKSYMQIKEITLELERLIEEDMSCYPAYLAANKLPQETTEEKEIRNASLEAASIQSIEVPLEMMRLAKKGMKIASNMIPHGNKRLLTDLLSGVIYFYSCIESASLYVFENMSSLENLDLKQNYYKEAKEILDTSREFKDSIVEAYRPR